ncbi:MAG: DUF1566 domain-containing protein, partial [Methylococcaceae bacterium]
KPWEQNDRIGKLFLTESLGTCSSSISKSSKSTIIDSATITLPTEKDWSDIVTPVKDQGQCGSCVIFSTTAALESALLKQKKGTFDISEQYSLSCLMPQTLCQTGTQISSYLEPLKSTGTSQELSQYPYIAPSLGNCNAAGKFLTPYNFSFKANSFEKVGIESADDLKATLVKYGPVVGSLMVHSSFQDYTTGLYRPNSYDSRSGGHAILIVGYSDAIGGFKVKNSWGTDWGDKGFFWIAYDQVGGQSDFGTRGGGVFAITDASAPDVAPTYVINSSNVNPSSGKSGSSFQFNATLNMDLPSDWKVKIDLGTGILSQMSGFRTDYSLSRNLTNVGTYTYKIGIYDSRDILQGVISSGTYTVETAAPVVTTTGYTKIANDGSVLSDNATLGSNPRDWACTKDNKTGLIWEVKTDDGGLRDKDWTYSWYKPVGDNGGDVGYQNKGSCKGSECDTYAFTNALNKQGLCGATDWRMPTIDELKGLLRTTSTMNQPLNIKLYIDPNYFPNSNLWFWSSSPSDNGNIYAWGVYFYGGYSNSYGSKFLDNFVRLVRNSSNSPIVNPTPTPVIVTTVTNVAPTLKLISNSPDAVVPAPVPNYNVGVSYNVTVQANDTDGNLKSVDIDWGDGAKESSAQSNGGVQIPFTHTYNSAGTYTWKVIAYDLNGLTSNSVSKTLRVENPSVPVVAGFAAPKLLTPENNAYLPLKKSMIFTWEKANQATKYQIIFAADSNFSSYDKVKNKCLNTQTCFTYTVASTSYALNANHAMVKTEGVQYYWQVQSLNKTQRSASSEIRTFTVGTPKPAIPPEIVKVSPTYQNVLGKQMSFTANLNVSFPQNFYSVKVSIDDGDFQTMSMAVTDTQFIYNFYPTEIGDHHFTVAIFDNDGVIIDTLGDDFTVISGGDNPPIVVNPIPVTPVVVNPPVSNSGYTKIANNGSMLPDSAKLGNASTDWTCTKDNKTGLIWEVKTTDGGLRDSAKTYTWNQGNDFASSVNGQRLCGFSNWRLPTKGELEGLVYCSDGKTKALGKDESGYICTGSPTKPTINATYFPNTKENWFWSSSPYANGSGNAWGVTTSSGGSYGYYRDYYGNVRLVRG